MKIKANYKSYFFVSIFPSIIFLSVLILVTYSGINYFGPDRLWLNIVIFVGGVFSAVAVVLAAYPLVKKLGSFKRGVLEIAGDRITWKTGFKKKTINVSEEYIASIYSGKAAANVNDVIDNTIITIENNANSIAVSLRGMRNQVTMAYFKENSFVYGYSFTPESGIAAFDLSYKKAVHRDCIAELLKLLWSSRNKNKFYAIHSSFPWDSDGKEETIHTEILEYENQEDRTSIAALQQKAIVNFQDIFYVSENCILARGTLFDKSTCGRLNDSEDVDSLYAQIPVGYCSAEMKVRTGSNNSMERYMKISGMDGKQNEIILNIIMPFPEFTNDEHLQLMTVMRYINSNIISQASRNM